MRPQVGSTTDMAIVLLAVPGVMADMLGSRESIE
jgi:hypothetical protein